jgi:hypothetical protein
MPSYTEGGPDRAAYPQPPYSSTPQDGYPQQGGYSQQGYPQPSSLPYGQQPPYGMTAAEPDRNAAARRTLIWGALWFFGGIVLTVAILIGSHGTRVPIFWGASIYGIIQLVRGGIAMSKANA